MKAKVYYLKNQELVFGNIIHEICTGKEVPDNYPIITWIYKWDGDKTAFSEALNQLISYNMWPN